MIYTVTLNPSLDYLMRTEHFTEGGVNRSFRETIVAGGKGINVSVMLHNLGVPSVALGFVAGFTGEELCRMVRALGVREDFIRLASGMTRINVKLRAERESEINGAGPLVPRECFDMLLAKMDVLTPEDTLVLSGSIPPSLPGDAYTTLAARASQRGARLVADLSGKLLFDLLPYRPWLVKPNHHELGVLFDTDVRDKPSAAYYACRLRDMGAQNVLVSMAGEGAVLASEDGKVSAVSAAHGEVVNSVGAGDSMVAGFLAGMACGDRTLAMRLGAAAGGATAFAEGIADGDAVRILLPTVFCG